MALARTSVSAFQSSAAGFTVAPGAGAAAGDLGILVVETANQSMTTPTGWSVALAGTGFGTAGAAGASRLYVFYRNGITSTEASTGVVLADSGDHQCACMMTYSGFNTTTPYVIGAIKEVSVATTSGDTNAVNSTDVKNGDILLGIFATDRDSATASTNGSVTWSNTSGSNSYTVNGSTATGAGGGLIVNEQQATSDATGGVGISPSITSSAYSSVVMVIKKATSGTTFNQSCLTSTTPSPTLVRSPGKIARTTSTPVPTAVRSIGKPAQTTSTPVPTAKRSTGKPLQTTSTPVPTATKQSAKSQLTASTPVPTLAKSTGKIARTTSTPVPTMTKANIWARSLTTATTPVPTLAKSTAKPISISITVNPAMVKSMSKPIQGQSTPEPWITTIKVKILSVQTQSTPSINLSRVITKTAQGQSTPTPSLARSTSKSLQTTATPEPSLLKVRTVTLLGSSVPVPTISKAMAKSLRTTTVPVPTLAANRFFVRSFQAVVGGVVSGGVSGPRVSAIFFK